MKICSTVDLREKEVVNVCGGAKLGCAEDFDFDTCSGRIIALVIAGDGGLFGFSKKEDLIIPWEKIKCIGEDAVLVSIEPDELRCMIRDRRKKKKKLPL